MAKYYYEREISHHGLNKYRVIKGESRYDVDQKANAVLAQWDEQWKRQQEREAKRKEREAKIRDAEESMEYASEMTNEADRIQQALDDILHDSIDIPPFDFETLKEFSKYPERKPSKPYPRPLPVEPQAEDEKYNPKPTLLIKLSKKKLEEFVEGNRSRFNEDHQKWEIDVAKISEQNENAQSKYNQQIGEWTEEEAKYKEQQRAHNQSVDELEAAYKQGENSAIEKVVSTLLERIEYPFDYNYSVETEYQAASNSLIVDVMLPIIDDLPRLKSVSYVKSKNEFKKSFFSDSYMKKKYDHVIYQMVLQILNYVFCTVPVTYIDAVTINGKVHTIDKATGNDIDPYILSVRVSREDFANINLSAVDPKMWFKNAKGVSAANIANITPVAPVVQMTRTDSRFVEGYDVAENIDESVNLASMDWKDFENLIREIFEQEFNTNGGEVKITQASRDGGVDAVAFDPDPIRGGKIVIQAKRYTNVVGVSAVRDLYGTVMNEGATKGILVTTSHFGNDAYSFAQGKPLTLMDGANLLYLLEKHGHKARIDINEAKKA